MSAKQLLNEIIAYARYIALIGGALLIAICLLRLVPELAPFLPRVPGELWQLAIIAGVATYVGRG